MMVLKSKTNDSCSEVKFEIIKSENGIIEIKMNGESITHLLAHQNLILDKSGAKLLLEFHIAEIK